jgi:hypothetical protein
MIAISGIFHLPGFSIMTFPNDLNIEKLLFSKSPEKL